MNILDVPLVITSLVLKHAAVVCRDELPDEWKYTLELLSVCRFWRNIAEPMVYKTLYIFEYDKPKKSALNLRTNAKLITMLTKTKLVKNILIDSSCHAHFEFASLACLELFAPTKHNWLNVSAMRIHLRNSNIAGGISNSHLLAKPKSAIKSAVEIFVNYMVESMPRISLLSILNRQDSYLNQTIGDRMVYAYRKSLQMASLNFSILPDNLLHLNKLTRLSLGYTSHLKQVLSKINVEILTELALYKVKHEFTFAQFLSNPKLGSVKFQRLKKLLLLFDKNERTNTIEGTGSIENTGTENVNIFTVHCTALQSLTMTHMPIHIFESTRMMFSLHLKHIKVVNSVFLLDKLCSWDVDSIEKLTIGAFSGPTAQTDKYICQASCPFIKNTKRLNYFEIITDYLTAPQEITASYWEVLTFVEIVRINSDIYFEKLIQLPRLKKLVVQEFVDDNMSSDFVKRMESMDLNNIESQPAAGPLEVLNIQYIEVERTTELAMKNYLFYIAAQTVTLLNIGIDIDSSVQINTLIDTYGDNYSHLKDIKYYHLY